MNLQLQVCAACGHAHFPDMLLCAACGGARFSHADVATGELVAMTDISYRVGESGGEATLLGLLRTEPEAFVLARVDGKAQPGETLCLRLVGRAVWAGAQLSAD